MGYTVKCKALTNVRVQDLDSQFSAQQITVCVKPLSRPNPFLGSFGAKIEYGLASTCVAYNRNEFMNGGAEPKREDGKTHLGSEAISGILKRTRRLEAPNEQGLPSGRQGEKLGM